MSGYTHDGWRHAASISRSLQAIRYMLAVGPPRSEMTPVKPGVLSRIVSISRRIESSERFWMMRPSCSVIEQKVQPPKQPRMIVTEKLDHLVGGDLRVAVARVRRARVRQLVDARPSPAWSSGSGGGLSQTSRSPWRCTSARALPGLVSRCSMREACAYSTGSPVTCSKTAGGRRCVRGRVRGRRAERHQRRRGRASRRSRAAPRTLGCDRVRIRRASIGPAGRASSSRSRSSPPGTPAAARTRCRACRAICRSALAGGQAVRDLDDRALGVAVDQQVGLGVDQHRAAHLVGPVVVVGDAAQARLDAADHDRHVARTPRGSAGRRR